MPTKVHRVAVRDASPESEDDLAGANVTRKASGNKTSAAKTASKTAAKRKAPAKASRTALKDKTNVRDDDEQGSEDEGRPKAKKAKTATTKRVRATKPTLAAVPNEDENAEPSIEIDNVDDMDINRVPTPEQAQRFVQRPREASVQPVSSRPAMATAPATSTRPAIRERSGSISATERERRGGDAELRRALSDMTKKYENLTAKYQTLQEIGQSQAEMNFEKVKRASDQKAKDANELIASLKKEIAELRKCNSSSSSELAALQKQNSVLSATEEKLNLANEDLKEKLGVAKNETKTLEAKLSAARQQITTLTQDNKTSAPTHLNRGGLGAVTESQKESRMIVDMYADLTGLLIRGVKHKDDEDEFDCIQTGRNGALHFHLSVMNDTSASNAKAPNGTPYEDTEFAYEPLLEDGRDRMLLEVLPDYLTEEICFPRNHLNKFYSKVMESVTQKIEVITEEES